MYEGGELDDLRVQMLKHKMHFESELLRMNQVLEARCSEVEQQLKAKDTEVEALRATVSALGKKLDSLTFQSTSTQPTNPISNPIASQTHTTAPSPTVTEQSLGQTTDYMGTSPTKTAASIGSTTATGSPDVIKQAQHSVEQGLYHSLAAAKRAISRKRRSATALTATSSTNGVSDNNNTPAPAPRPTSRRGSHDTSVSTTKSPRRLNLSRRPPTPTRSEHMTPVRRHPPFLAAAILPPEGSEDVNKFNTAPPDAELELEAVYGCYSRFGADLFSYKQLVICYTAALGVVFDRKDKTQKFYTMHTEEISSMAQHPNGHIVATGDTARSPVIYIWDILTLETLAVLRGFHERGIRSLAFAPSGHYLAAVGMDSQHTLLLHKWQTRQVVADTKVQLDEIYFAKWNPHHLGKLIVCGKHVLRFYDVDWVDPRRMVVKNGIIGTRGKLQKMWCIHCVDKDTSLTGTDKGEIYVWKGSAVTHIVDKVHTGPITAITSTANFPWLENVINNVEDGCGLLTAGRDGRIHIWSHYSLQQQWKDQSSQPTSTVNLHHVFAAANDGTEHGIGSSAVKAVTLGIVQQGEITISSNGFSLLVIINSGVWAINLNTEQGINLIQNTESEVNDIDCHPVNTNIFATVSANDKTLRLWDSNKHKQNAVINLPYKARCCGFSPDGQYVAVGLQGNNIQVLQVGSYEAVFTSKHRLPRSTSSSSDHPHHHDLILHIAEISCLAFSPDSSILAVASTDRYVELYDVKNEWTVICRTHSHNAPVVAMDWSVDSTVLQTLDTSHELLYFDGRGSFIGRPASVRSLSWFTWSCRLGWPVQGLWPLNSTATNDVLCVNRNKHGTLLVSGDNRGCVNLYNWPSPIPQSHCKKYSGHALPTQHVMFSCDDEHLFSSSGAVLFQWKIHAHKITAKALNFPPNSALLDNGGGGETALSSNNTDDESLPDSDST